ncbi:hypothetical protein [Methylorubrum extorquens]|uniref:hypothetical protein n=1 Tax=Methylorubrum extorquens TaxID=408 RepID=UPI0020A1D99A|nr:hypothetical protein [Methylorubrum extorquens]MCP1537685.1 hypothetical protein [Methylorubrum extorquens]
MESYLELQVHRSHTIPKPFGGDHLTVACQLDAALPGYLSAAFHASALKRTAQFIAYAETDFDRPHIMAARLAAISPTDISAADPLAQMAKALILLRPPQIIQAVYGTVPPGLIGLLARFGHDPLRDPADYRLAFNLFSQPENRARTKLLGQIEGKITAKSLRIIARIDPIFLRPHVLERVRSETALEALHEALALIRRLVQSATDATLMESLDHLSPRDRDLSKWIEAWLRKSERLLITPPIPVDDPDLRLIPLKDLDEVGRRFGNCLGSRIAYGALGCRLYYEWGRDQTAAAIELRALSGGAWVIEQIRGTHNQPVTPAGLKAIRAKFSSYGVLSYVAPGLGRAGSRLASLLRAYDLADTDADEEFDDAVDGIVEELADLVDHA